jgi:hypothetical protein
MRNVIVGMLAAALCAPALAQSTPVQEKAEITVTNNRDEPVLMTFDYAFRQYTWNLVKHEISAQDEILYRFPSNIPGCEYMREWQITDGVLRISNGSGLLCEKRISLCDKRVSSMAIEAKACRWADK